MIEAEKGWLSGPFDPGSPEAAGLLSNRFGVMQKGKIRCVDDMSASLINATTFAEEKITLHNVDVICAAIGRWYQLRQKAGLPTKLLAKSFDLKSAYTQLPIASCARRHAGLALSDPKGRSPKTDSSLKAELNISQEGCLSQVARFSEDLPSPASGSSMLERCPGTANSMTRPLLLSKLIMTFSKEPRRDKTASVQDWEE